VRHICYWSWEGIQGLEYTVQTSQIFIRIRMGFALSFLFHTLFSTEKAKEKLQPASHLCQSMLWAPQQVNLEVSRELFSAPVLNTHVYCFLSCLSLTSLEFRSVCRY